MQTNILLYIENNINVVIKMFEELGAQIDFILQDYKYINEKWKNSKYYEKINMKNTTVFDVHSNQKIFNVILNYREFMYTNNMVLMIDFDFFNTEKAKVNIRIKTRNSIEYKLENYTKNHENGKIPLNKCLNDLFGIRIITEFNANYKEIKEFIKRQYPKLKVIDSSKGQYKAIHIYFKEDNYQFQWELQIWKKEDEEKNIKSHEIYKQDYARWEKEMKGGKK